MPLDVQARGPAEQLLLDRSMVGEDEPSGDARTVSPGSGTPRRSSAPPATDCRVNAKTRAVSRIISTAAIGAEVCCGTRSRLPLA
jgi:hypothetical protein